MPEYFRVMSATIESENLNDLKTYLRWHLVHNRARYLSRRFVDENFAFYSAYLRDVKEQPPRWKRCVQWVDRDLGAREAAHRPRDSRPACRCRS